MPQLSVVIITKNEARNIVACILSAKKISNDIIVIDSGSTDATLLLAKREGVKVESICWKSYGHARNTGAELALNHWILALDADERVTDELVTAVSNIKAPDNNNVYGFKRSNFFGKTKIHFGALAHDRVFRLYNRFYCRWNLVPAHEKLIGQNMQRVTLRVHIIHYGILSKEQYVQKKMNYAILCGLKYQQENKRFVHINSFISPVFSFIKAYIFQLGFLDGHYGYCIAKTNAAYTRKKYQHLQWLLHHQNNTNQIAPALQNAFTAGAITFFAEK